MTNDYCPDFGGKLMQKNWERLRDAVVVLAGAGPAKQRLLHAYQKHLADFEAEDLPRELRAPYSAVSDALHRVPRTGTCDTLSASVLKMSEDEAGRHAQEIVRIFGDLSDPQALARQERVLRAVPDEPVPAMLSRA
jgi:hypothetical protein